MTVILQGQIKKNKSEIQFERIWRELLKLKKLENPVEMIQVILTNEFGLAPSTAYQGALKFVKLVDAKGKVLVTRGQHGHFDNCLVIDDNAKLTLKDLESTNVLPNPKNLMSRLVAEMSKVSQVKVVKPSTSVNGQKTNDTATEPAIGKRVAVWIDSPNLTAQFTSWNYQTPLTALLRTIQENLGELVFTGVFHNTNCSGGLLRFFKRNDCTLINCVSQKNFYDASYDPVDEELISTVRKLVQIADYHVIVSGDRDFQSLIAFVKQKPGKDAFRVYTVIKDARPLLRFNIGTERFEIQSEPFSERQSAAHN